jgi:RNA polymerase sigma factor (sigma-70 family)
MTETPALEELARRAVDGDRDAVAGLIRGLQHQVYALALRMLWNPADAEDATQEILVRVVTRLGQFNFESRLTTWVFRVATNYLLDVKKSSVERERVNFTAFAADLHAGLSGSGPAEQEHSVLVEEVRVGCTLGLLQCLDRDHRLAYVLGEILEWPAPEAAEALDIEPAAFRKRLQRARAAIETFTREHCGLASGNAACACHRRVPAAIRLGRVEPQRLRFAQAGESFAEAREFISRIHDTRRVIAVQQAAKPGIPLRDFVGIITSAMGAG